MRLTDTIVAISTPPGRGGLGIIRISGSEACPVAESVLRLPANHKWQAWKSSLGTLIDDTGATVDEAVVTYFAAPRSYTAEHVVEISCHGAPVILRHALDRAVRAGARLAEPGEFTLRAYLRGRLDLPQAEAVRDLIDATTLYQARVAAQQVNGALSQRIRPIKEQLLELIALLEAGIDFAEDDISVAEGQELRRRLLPIHQEICTLAESFAFGKLVHNGFTLAIVGRPNAGKSSLFNRLIEQDRAIVTDVPGTTRDAVSETASLEGIPVRFVDTAGIREGQDIIESLGIERSWQTMADADLTLVVVDLSRPFEPEDRQLLDRAAQFGRCLQVGNKADLAATVAPGVIAVSALTGAGIEELRHAIITAIAPAGALAQEASFITSLRHERLLQESSSALQQAGSAIEQNIPHEMLLLDLYSALSAIDTMTGATTADDILNRIFSTFCIGK